MKKITALLLTAIITLFVLLFILFGFDEVIDFLWMKIEKIGALATALALIFAIKQGQIAQKSASHTETASQENLFQQSFNLILEQHNTEMRIVKEWLSNSDTIRISDNENHIKTKDQTTDQIVKSLRGHNKLSPYMRLLHHTLKTIKFKYGTTNINEKQFLSCKRYSSLVRCFIPNELLYLIALNALITNNSFGKDTDYLQYKDYYDNLVYFDFFEHLIIEKQDTTFSQFIKSLEQELIKDVLDQVNNSISTRPTNEEPHHIHILTNGHIRFINNLFRNPHFCISIYYNHPEKYLSLDENYITNKTFKENIGSNIDQFFMINNKNNSIEIFNNEFNQSITKHIDFHFKKQCSCERAPQGTIHTYRFLDFEDSHFISYLHGAMNLSQSINDLTHLKDNLSSIISQFLDIYSHDFLPDEPHVFKMHYNKTHAVFCEKFGNLIEKIIRTKYYISNVENVESLFLQKKQEMDNVINLYLAGIN